MNDAIKLNDTRVNKNCKYDSCKKKKLGYRKMSLFGRFLT